MPTAIANGSDQSGATRVEQPPTSGAQATGDGTDVTTETAGGADGEETGTEEEAGAESEVTELIPAARFEELKGDPGKLHKELLQAVNKKFRDVADVRKGLAPYRDFIAALDANPKAAIAAVAKQFGMKVEGGTEENAEAIAAGAKTKMLDSVRAALGPEYEDLAERLIPAISAVADSVIKEALAPVLEKQDEIIADSATRASQVAMEAFAKKHPDWKKHEDAMVKMSKKFPPGEGVTDGEYLESIYHLVTRDGSEGAAVRRTVDRMKQAAENDSGSRNSTVSGDKVTARPATLPTFREAAAAAMRGQRLE